MKRIPKVAYFYWGGSVMPYLRYMSMASFKKYNPEWKVIVFTPVQLTTSQSWTTFENKEALNTKDYMPQLQQAGVVVSPFDMQGIGFPNEIPEVLKSDILRLFLLSKFGGLWCDDDILFFRPLTHTLEPTECNAYFCYRRGGPTQEDTAKNGPRYHSIGFLAGAPGNVYFTKLFDGVRNVFNPTQYQSAGSPYYKTVYAEPNMDRTPDVYNIDVNTVYPTRAALSIFTLPAGHFMNEVLTPKCIGIHWYGGAPASGQYQNLVTGETYGQHDNIVCWLLDKVNRGIQV